MATVTIPAQQKVILKGVSWGTYQRLLSEHLDESGTHFTYNEGSLEIMVLSGGHEQPKRAIEILVDLISEEWGIDVVPVGSVTFQREELQKGFEPDSAYYITNASRVEGRVVDPAEDPPPDLIIEIDVTSPSLPRFPIFAAFGVPEVWRYDGRRVRFHLLEGTRYVETASSAAFPLLSSEAATRFLEQRKELRSTEWARQVREWARGRDKPDRD